MKDFKLYIYLLVLILLPYSDLFASTSLPLEINGNYFIRLPKTSKYTNPTLKKYPDNTIYSIPDINNASNSTILLDGHEIKVFPGSVFKISKGFFVPLAGRYEFASDETATNSINIIVNNCNAGYSFGHFIIEATPDNGVFFALKSSGRAWVKDSFRKVFELRQGQQVHVPLFGASVLRNRVESFWGKEPSSFGNLGEVGRETAYGIVGNDSTFNNYLKSTKKDLTKDKKNDNNTSKSNKTIDESEKKEEDIDIENDVEIEEEEDDDDDDDDDDYDDDDDNDDNDDNDEKEEYKEKDENNDIKDNANEDIEENKDNKENNDDNDTKVNVESKFEKDVKKDNSEEK